MIGIQSNKIEVNQTIGQNILNIKNELDRAARIKTFLATNNDAVLTAAPFDFSPDEIYAIRVLYDALDGIRTTFNNIPQVPMVVGLG
jgi:hypothetical protein